MVYFKCIFPSCSIAWFIKRMRLTNVVKVEASHTHVHAFIDTRTKRNQTAAIGSQRTLDGCMLNQAKRLRMSNSIIQAGSCESVPRDKSVQTTKRFSLNTRTIGCWVADEESPMLVLSRTSHLTVNFLARSLVSFPDPALTEIDVW